MRAVVRDRYGSPDVLRFADVPTPVPGDGEVLVRVRATSINSWDWDLLRGTFQGRLGFMAWRRPKHRTLGADVAGVVEALGRDVHDLQVGDAVFGDVSGHGWGGFGEYLAAPEEVLARVGPGMAFEQAAAMPQAGLLALQALRLGRLRAGQQVLINGAGGGVGTFAVQLARSADADVTGVDHSHA